VVAPRTVLQKTEPPNSTAVTLSKVNRFSKFFIVRLSNKFAVK